MRVVLLGMLLIAFAACEKAAEKTAEKAMERATGGEVDVKGNTVTIKGEDGKTVTVVGDQGKGEAVAVVCHPVLREVVRTDLLRAVAGADLRTSLRLDL